jgi:hypothetical protein
LVDEILNDADGDGDAEFNVLETPLRYNLVLEGDIVPPPSCTKTR